MQAIPFAIRIQRLDDKSGYPVLALRGTSAQTESQFGYMLTKSIPGVGAGAPPRSATVSGIFIDINESIDPIAGHAGKDLASG